MDSDLAEAVNALKSSFERRGVPSAFGRCDPTLVTTLGKKLRLPRRYRDFMSECAPLDAETVTPAERVRLITPADLEEEQIGFALTEERALSLRPTASGWRPAWIIVARSTLLGDPYFLDTSDPDPEGDCPVYTAMSGTEVWQPKLAASSFALFVRVLAIGMEVAQDFDVDDYDVDNEQVFREAIGPKIREYDPAAMKAGHWT